MGAAKRRQSDSFATIGPKTAKFGPTVVFLVIFGQILVFLAHLAPCPIKKEKIGWFLYDEVLKFYLQTVIIVIIGQQTPDFA